MWNKMLLVILRKVDVCNLQCEVALNSNIFLDWVVSPLLPSMFCHIFLEFSQYAHTGEMHGAILNWWYKLLCSSKFLSKWYFKSVCNLVTSQDCFVSNAAPFLPFRSEIDKIMVETHHMTTASVWPLFFVAQTKVHSFSHLKTLLIPPPVITTNDHLSQSSVVIFFWKSPHTTSPNALWGCWMKTNTIWQRIHWMFLGKGVLVVNMTAGKLQHSVKRMQLVNY